MSYPVSLQIYLGLSQQEERQLFSDTNTERKEAHSGLQLKYDQRDKYRQLTRSTALALREKMDIEMEASRLTKYNTSITSLTTMRRCLIALFEGVLTEKKVNLTLEIASLQKYQIYRNDFLSLGSVCFHSVWPIESVM